jgi:hypothetical protein
MALALAFAPAERNGGGKHFLVCSPTAGEVSSLAPG